MYSWEAGEHEKVGESRKLNIPTFILDARIQGVNNHHHSSDHHDQGASNQRIDDLETMAQDRIPPDVWLLRSKDALGEKEIDDVKDQHAGINENLSG
jgi:hypothetical protein